MPIELEDTMFLPTGVISAQAGIHKIVVLLQIISLDLRLRGDDTSGKQNREFSSPKSIVKIFYDKFRKKILVVIEILFSRENFLWKAFGIFLFPDIKTIFIPIQYFYLI